MIDAARDQRLIELWPTTLSGAAIAERIGYAGRGGVYRRARELGLPPRAKPNGITRLELTSETCRWPLGEGPALRFCGVVGGNGPYCAEHAKISYSPSTWRPR